MDQEFKLRDATSIDLLLKKEGVEKYDPRVVNLLLEYMHAYTRHVLIDAKDYQAHARKEMIDKDDIKLAVENRTVDTNSGREALAKYAQDRQRLPLGPVPTRAGFLVPPKNMCTTAPNYKVVSAKDIVVAKTKPVFVPAPAPAPAAAAAPSVPSSASTSNLDASAPHSVVAAPAPASASSIPSSFSYAPVMQPGVSQHPNDANMIYAQQTQWDPAAVQSNMMNPQGMMHQPVYDASVGYNTAYPQAVQYDQWGQPTNQWGAQQYSAPSMPAPQATRPGMYYDGRIQ